MNPIKNSFEFVYQDGIGLFYKTCQKPTVVVNRCKKRLDGRSQTRSEAFWYVFERGF